MELVSHVGVTRLVLGRTRTNVHACHSCVYIQTHIHVPFLRPNTTKQLVPAHIYVHTRQRGSQTALLCKPPLINTIQPTHSRNVKACMHTMHTRSKQLKQKKWSLSLSLSLSFSLCTSFAINRTHFFPPYLESEAQCIAYILAKWPRSVFLVLKLTLLIAGTSLVTSLRVVSATANRASYRNIPRQ